MLFQVSDLVAVYLGNGRDRQALVDELVKVALLSEDMANEIADDLVEWCGLNIAECDW